MSDVPLDVNVQTVKQMLDNGDDFFFLDCREPNEFEAARVEGAVLIPMGEITGRVQELADFQNKKIVVMCHLGGRSLRVTHWLRQNGFANAQNMTGGIDAWSEQIDPNVPKY